MQWNLSIMDTLGPDIFPLSEVKNVLVISIGTKIFAVNMEVFSIEFLIWRVC